MVRYPVNTEVLAALKEYPEINKGMPSRISGGSDCEIVRVLGNLHYTNARSLADFIENNLYLSGRLGKRILRETDHFQFNQTLAELFLLSHLEDSFGDQAAPHELPKGVSGHDIDVSTPDFTVKIEVYSPVELMGFQLLESGIQRVLRYLNVPYGYLIRCSIEPITTSKAFDPQSFYYPYTIPDENVVRKWLLDFETRVERWITKQNSENKITIVCPGDKLQVIVKLLDRCNDQNDRAISTLYATRSTDTSLFFRCTPEEFTRTEWGQKLKRKLLKQQCGQSYRSTSRLFVLNFFLADTPRPEFINESWFISKFDRLIKYLIADELPYDMILPGRLGVNCCFGTPVIINPQEKQNSLRFIQDAKMGTPCTPSK